MLEGKKNAQHTTVLQKACFDLMPAKAYRRTIHEPIGLEDIAAHNVGLVIVGREKKHTIKFETQKNCPKGNWDSLAFSVLMSSIAGQQHLTNFSSEKANSLKPKLCGKDSVSTRFLEKF